MTLSEDYLAYPHRKYGYEHGRYEWRIAAASPRYKWPEGRTVALMVVMPLEFFPLDPGGKPFKHPGAMVTPYPDLRHYTSRDYGNRVGAFRILRCLTEAGIKVTVPVNAVLLTRIRPLIDAIRADGHEIAAHGWDTDAIHWSGLDGAKERDYVARTRDAFEKAGLAPRSWLSPARQQSFVTLDLIREAGFDVCLDWEADKIPLKMATSHGPVWSVPLMNELDDRTLLIARTQSEEEWARQIVEAVDYTASVAAEEGGGLVSFTLTPYITGQPFRVAPLRVLLNTLCQDRRVWAATASAIADAAAGKS